MLESIFKIKKNQICHVYYDKLARLNREEHR